MKGGIGTFLSEDRLGEGVKAVGRKTMPDSNAISSSTEEPRSGTPPSVADQPTSISNRPPIADVRPRPPIPAPAGSTMALVGCQLLHFLIDEYVAGGGMGAVFKGRDLILGRTVAVKVLARDHIDEDTIRRFRHEAQSAARLDHPAIPQVYYAGDQDGWYFIVFEFIEGRNVREIVAERGGLPIAQTVSYLADIAAALQHASSRNVVHRDIKPSNVLITPDGHAKLVDMGLARSNNIHTTTNDLTATGVTLGTFDYISPEQARDPRLADIRSDIYSLGCAFYFMLTGRPPFPDGTMLQKLLSHSSDAPPDPSEFRDDVPPRVTDMLSRMLAKKPEHRFQSADELLGEILLTAHELNLPIRQQGPTTLVIEQPIIRETGWRRHIPWLVPLIMLLTTALTLEISTRWQGTSPPPPSVPNITPSAEELPEEVSTNSIDR